MLYYMAEKSTNCLRLSLLYKHENLTKPILDSESIAYYSNFFHKENAFRHVNYQTLDSSTEIMCFLVF